MISTAISIALYCALLTLNCMFVMPESTPAPASVERTTVFERINEARAARQSTTVVQHEKSMPHRSDRAPLTLRDAMLKWDEINAPMRRIVRFRTYKKTRDDGTCFTVRERIPGYSHVGPQTPNLADVNAERAERMKQQIR